MWHVPWIDDPVVERDGIWTSPGGGDGSVVAPTSGVTRGIDIAVVSNAISNSNVLDFFFFRKRRVDVPSSPAIAWLYTLGGCQGLLGPV